MEFRVIYLIALIVGALAVFAGAWIVWYCRTASAGGQDENGISAPSLCARMRSLVSPCCGALSAMWRRRFTNESRGGFARLIRFEATGPFSQFSGLEEGLESPLV